jgi:hypothetical protein
MPAAVTTVPAGMRTVDALTGVTPTPAARVMTVPRGSGTVAPFAKVATPATRTVTPTGTSSRGAVAPGPLGAVSSVLIGTTLARGAGGPLTAGTATAAVVGAETTATGLSAGFGLVPQLPLLSSYPPCGSGGPPAFFSWPQPLLPSNGPVPWLPAGCPSAALGFETPAPSGFDDDLPCVFPVATGLAAASGLPVSLVVDWPGGAFSDAALGLSCGAGWSAKAAGVRTAKAMLATASARPMG